MKNTRESVKKKTEKSTYQQIIDGDIEPTGSQKGWLNLKPVPFGTMDAERQREISRKGAQAVNKLHGEKKTARESLEKILTLKVTPEIIAGADVPDEIAERLRRDNPNATLYDLINLVAVGRAVSGSVGAMTFIRDTHGDKPIERVEVTENITTDADRELMRSIAERLEQAESVQIVENITDDDVKTGDDNGDNST